MSAIADRIVADAVTVRRHGRTVLESVDAEVVSGRVLGVVGPSGAGKTTLLRVLAGLIRPDAGTVRHGVLSVPAPASVAVLAQTPRHACNPRWSLRSVIAEPARIAGRSADAMDELVSTAAERVGLDLALLERFPSQVSDGQLQRALLARILVQAPAFVLADEPVAMLDPVSARSVLAVLDSLTESGTGLALVSHNTALVHRRAHQSVEL